MAGARIRDGSVLLNSMRALLRGDLPEPMQSGQAATIAVHTLADGDTVFALAAGASGLTASVSLLGAVAAEVLALAVLRAVRAAQPLEQPGLPHLPAARQFTP